MDPLENHLDFVSTKKTIHSDQILFDRNDPRVKEDIIRMIVQYLRDEGYHVSAMTIQDEANVKYTDELLKQTQIKKMKKAILEGDWQEVEKLCSKQLFKNRPNFLYSVYKQQYLELLENQEYQKAFTYLTKRLKPLESQASSARPSEFRDLCYLLTCRTIQEVPGFEHWDGYKGSSREKLVEQFQSLLDAENITKRVPQVELPPDRLLKLLWQSVAYQIEFTRYHPKLIPKITTLLEDYSCYVVPNAEKCTYFGHKENVKCVEFLGEEGLSLVTGSSDNTIRVWKSDMKEPVSKDTVADERTDQDPQQSGEGLSESAVVNNNGNSNNNNYGNGVVPNSNGTGTWRTGEEFRLEGHSSRIWDLSSNATGSLVASASGDSTIKLWDIEKRACVSTIGDHSGDVYAVKFHPGQKHLCSGGYDKTVKLFDVQTGTTLKTFTGHNSSVSTVTFNPIGNLIISGSKDNTIKFWDITSGVCIKTSSSHLGEVTSIELNSNGTLMLSGSKDNSNRLWDIRAANRRIQRFKGHQNTSKNFVRCAFGPNQSLIIGGSEDGLVYIWDIATGNIIQKLAGHRAIVYEAKWNPQQSLIASCSDDGTLKTWWYDQSLPLFSE